MTFNLKLSVVWQVCISLHFNLQQTQALLFLRIRSQAFGQTRAICPEAVSSLPSELLPRKLQWVLLSQNSVQRIFTLPKSLTAQMCKTAIKSFYLSCRSLFRRQGNLLPWDRYSYGQRLSRNMTQYWSQISANLQTSLAKPCVFAIQSLDKCCCYPEVLQVNCSILYASFL